jgi:hypothetical protein
MPESPTAMTSASASSRRSRVSDTNSSHQISASISNIPGPGRSTACSRTIKGTGRHDGYRLSEIIASADFINHTILTEAEFTHALPRLLAAGLIGADVQTDRYWLTEAGQALYRQRMKRRGLFGSSTGLPRDTSGALTRP